MDGPTQVLFSAAQGQGAGQALSLHTAWAEILAHLASSVTVSRLDSLSVLPSVQWGQC